MAFGFGSMQQAPMYSGPTYTNSLLGQGQTPNQAEMGQAGGTINQLTGGYPAGFWAGLKPGDTGAQTNTMPGFPSMEAFSQTSEGAYPSWNYGGLSPMTGGAPTGTGGSMQTQGLSQSVASILQGLGLGGQGLLPNNGQSRAAVSQWSWV